MKRRTVARLIALVLISYACAFLLVAFDKQEMQTYQSLSRDPLLAKLSEIHKPNFDASFIGSFFILGVVVLCVDGLTSVLELIINRISPLPPAAVPPADALARANGPGVG